MKTKTEDPIKGIQRRALKSQADRERASYRNVP